jgi:hypothetical protein
MGKVRSLQPSRANSWPRLLPRIVLSAGALLVAACGGGGSTPAPNEPIEVQLARQLAPVGIEKNPDFFPVAGVINEPALLAAKDQELLQASGALSVAPRFVNTLSKIAVRAQIARVNVFVVNDLACTSVPFGGGVATNAVIVLDGKLLDLMADVANGIALVETGRLQATISQVVDAAAAQQLAFGRYCAASDPLSFPDGALTQAERDRGVEVFAQLVGGLLFHEFGHIWNWHTLAGLRDQILFPSGGFFRYTSALEDNADLIAGVLSAKAGHDPSLTKLTYDLMTFTYFYRRAPLQTTFAAVQSWETQYQQSSPTYSSLATRKALIDAGYRGWLSR